jgi:pilus assembly protein CpaF
MKLEYDKSKDTVLRDWIGTYTVTSMYFLPDFKDKFVDLRSNLVDLNDALIKKCIVGTEQDFLMLMQKAKEYLFATIDNNGLITMLLSLFQDCVFGYYVLTPLIKDPIVSDIKVYSWDHITVKVNGDRYLTNIKFFDEDDYNRWYDRLLRINRLDRSIDGALNNFTDRKSIDSFYMRVDIQKEEVTSSGQNMLHIRKTPTVKYTWQYLVDNKMLDDNCIEYLRDRVVNGYGFLISGRGGSGKSTLLNNMIDMIPYEESVLISQENDELYSDVHPQIQFEHPLNHKSDGKETRFTLEDELRLGLLQDIDDFIIGEIKGGEALYVFTTAMSTGARFMGTIHSNNCRGSVRRLAQLAKYISSYTVESLEEMLTATPFCLIHMSHFHIDEILEIVGWDEKKMELEYKEVYSE